MAVNVSLRYQCIFFTHKNIGTKNNTTNEQYKFAFPSIGSVVIGICNANCETKVSLIVPYHFHSGILLVIVSPEEVIMIPQYAGSSKTALIPPPSNEEIANLTPFEMNSLTESGLKLKKNNTKKKHTINAI